MTLAGRCRCGAATYALDYPDLPVAYACHCLECQTMSGGACVVQLPVAEHRLVVSGELALWDNPDSVGNLTTQRFCLKCRTRLFSTNSGRAGMTLVRGGTLERSDQLIPALHIWIKRKQPWISISDQTPAFPEAAPIEVSRTTFAPNFAPR